MKEKRTTGVWTVVGALTLLLVIPLVAYVVGYFLIGSHQTLGYLSGEIGYCRHFPHPTLAKAYIPLVRLESAITGTDVQLSWDMTDEEADRLQIP